MEDEKRDAVVEAGCLYGKIDTLENDVLTLEIENHTLKNKIKAYEFDRYNLQVIQRIAKAGTWELNHLSYELYISNELSRLLSDTLTDVEGVSWNDFVDHYFVSNDVDIKKEILEGVIQKRGVLDLEHYLKRPDGEVLYVHHHCKTFYNTIGQPLKTVGMIYDFTFEHEQSIALAKLSTTDELTQLGNRRRINEILSEQYHVFQRYGKTSSYIMLDLDHFKDINDSLGHQVGDEVLRELSAAIRQTIRNVDYAGRWGGEEFLIVCPNTYQKNAIILAEKLRNNIMALTFSAGLTITASLGVAEISRDEDTGDMLKRLDGALYEAKESGRNQVKSAPLPRASASS